MMIGFIPFVFLPAFFHHILIEQKIQLNNAKKKTIHLLRKVFGSYGFGGNAAA